VPDKGTGVGIVLGEVSLDGGLQVGDRSEDAAADEFVLFCSIRQTPLESQQNDIRSDFLIAYIRRPSAGA